MVPYTGENTVLFSQYFYEGVQKYTYTQKHFRIIRNTTKFSFQWDSKEVHYPN